MISHNAGKWFAASVVFGILLGCQTKTTVPSEGKQQTSPQPSAAAAPEVKEAGQPVAGPKVLVLNGSLPADV
jgi:hypothetical protein